MTNSFSCNFSLDYFHFKHFRFWRRVTLRKMTKNHMVTSLSGTAENFLKLEDDNKDKHRFEIALWAWTFRKQLMLSVWKWHFSVPRIQTVLSEIMDCGHWPQLQSYKIEKCVSALHLDCSCYFTLPIDELIKSNETILNIPCNL